MRKSDLTVPALLLEAVTIILVVVYIGMQIFYGIYYKRGIGTIVINAIAMILIYVAFTLLSNYPERVNRLPEEICQGLIRKYTLRMLRLEKLIFTVGLIVPCVFDVIGLELPPASSLILIGLMLLIVLIYESLIIKELRANH